MKQMLFIIYFCCKHVNVLVTMMFTCTILLQFSVSIEMCVNWDQVELILIRLSYAVIWSQLKVLIFLA